MVALARAGEARETFQLWQHLIWRTLDRAGVVSYRIETRGAAFNRIDRRLGGQSEFMDQLVAQLRRGGIGP